MRYSEIMVESLTAIPFETVDPIRRDPVTWFKIMDGDKILRTITSREVTTPEQALAAFHNQKPLTIPTIPLSPVQPKIRPQSQFELVTDYQSGPDTDDFYYHITSRPRTVIQRGLRPHSKPNMSDGFFRTYSQGKIFFCDRGGVSFWLGRISEHLEAQYDNPPKLAVVRFPKTLVPDAQHDRLGTEDSHNGAYFVTHAIPATRRAL